MKQLNIYLCGPTVYNSPHIGNIRPIMFFDLFVRAQKVTGTKVNFVHNITDIDDKIITKAQQQQTTEAIISQKYTNEYLQLLEDFNIELPTHIEEVTHNLDLINNYINSLIAQGAAYQVGQNVFFDVQKNLNYGIVSGQKLEKLISEEDPNLNKKHPADFTLWKSTTVGIKYDSPFGKGRPGWHTECSAIIAKHFGSSGVDIHAGGMDLKFPHHENENAQHFGLYNQNITKQWLWTGLINLDEQKMSKSLGNILLAKDFLVNYDKDIFRMIIMTSGATSTINLNTELLESNLKVLSRFKTLYNNYFLKHQHTSLVNGPKVKEFFALMAALNFAQANKLLHQLINNNKDDVCDTELISIFILLGFNFAKRKITDKQRTIYKQWQQARQDKDFTKADSLRQSLKSDDLL